MSWVLVDIVRVLRFLHKIQELAQLFPKPHIMSKQQACRLILFAQLQDFGYVISSFVHYEHEFPA